MNAEQYQTHNRNITDSRLGDNVTINQGDVHHHYPLEPPQPRKPNWLIPYLRNKEFVDRPGLVEKLNALLPHVSESFDDAALWGLGGSGKTQIALEHAYRQAENPQCSVFWVHADTRVAFIQDYKKIAALFGLVGIVDGQDSELLRAVSNRIQAEPEWLLVLDNADNLSLFGVVYRGVNGAPRAPSSPLPMVVCNRPLILLNCGNMIVDSDAASSAYSLRGTSIQGDVLYGVYS
ncbi:uncharacterized protein TrAtP1_004459 [Trichoderma atroviride]|uniref:uncharacterized protein n=1 Tax=Hypocrea atroviridis TaxID=63577 RepID=UPI003320AD43|nr:hypothetical protein TrAtP1_004459 [Trichoderma atroviride]